MSLSVSQANAVSDALLGAEAESALFRRRAREQSAPPLRLRKNGSTPDETLVSDDWRGSELGSATVAETANADSRLFTPPPPSTFDFEAGSASEASSEGAVPYSEDSLTVEMRQLRSIEDASESEAITEAAPGLDAESDAVPSANAVSLWA